MKKIFWLIVISLCFGFWFSSGMAAEPIKIAAIFAKTGDAAKSNAYSYRGVNLAVEEINKQGGVLGRPIEVIELDNKSTAIGSKEAALEAIKLNVTAVIGATWSSHSLVMAPILQEAGIPMITPNSTNWKVTLVGDYIFRVCFTDPFQGRVMAQFARQDLKAKTAVVLTNISDDYSMGLSESFRKSFVQNRGKILWDEEYLAKTTNFTDMLSKIQSLKPDVVFSPGHTIDSGLLFKQSVNMGIKCIFLGGDGWDLTIYELAGEAAEGNYYSDHWHPEAPFAKSQQFVTTYKNKYGNDIIISNVPLSFDAVMVLADAITRADSLERKKIRDALAATKDFKGTTGTITFDKNGDPLNKDAVVLQLKDGGAIFVKSIRPR